MSVTTDRPYASAADWLGLDGKTVLVTGAASGIGRATAQAFHALGASVIGVDRDAPADPGADGAISWHQLDIRNVDELAALRGQLESEGRRLDVLVPNAGINIRKPLLDVTEEEAERIVDVNLLGTLRTMRTFVPMMIAGGGGRVVVNSSATAEHSMRDRAVYGATKAALSGLVRSAALEWGPSNVTVNAVGPGVIRTALTGAYADANPERAQAAVDNVPLRRMGRPEDVADLIVYLGSRAAGFITGQTVMVDGGLTAGSTWW